MIILCALRLNSTGSLRNFLYLNSYVVLLCINEFKFQLSVLALKLQEPEKCRACQSIVVWSSANRKLECNRRQRRRNFDLGIWGRGLERSSCDCSLLSLSPNQTVPGIQHEPFPILQVTIVVWWRTIVSYHVSLPASRPIWTHFCSILPIDSGSRFFSIVWSFMVLIHAFTCCNIIWSS